jgi:prepilin-type N-terminal cleavage/methylation domain-containing protein
MAKTMTIKRAFSMVELLAVLAVLAVVAVIMVPRLTGSGVPAKSAACKTNKGDVELQVELWRHNTGGFPATNLSDIGTDLNYFPSGLPICPVDGSAYTIDSTGRIVGHNH